MSYLDRILEVDKAMTDKVMAAFDSVIFTTKENALRAGELLGLERTFSYTVEDGSKCWLPGQDLEQLSEYCEARPRPKRKPNEGDDTTIYKYKHPITQEYYYFERPGVYKEDDDYLVFVGKANHILVKELVSLFPGV